MSASGPSSSTKWWPTKSKTDEFTNKSSKASSLTAQNIPVVGVWLLIKVWMYLSVPFWSVKLGITVPVTVNKVLIPFCDKKLSILDLINPLEVKYVL